MKRFFVGVIISVLYCFSMPPTVRADYVLPYPGFMPGNKLYKVSRFLDKAKEPLYFGSLSAYKYHLGLADKYLVEAKVLFEYKQYLLAVDALARSDKEFTMLPRYLVQAGKQRKDVSLFEQQLSEAALMHKQILEELLVQLPDTFTWTPEKSAATLLPLKDLLQSSVTIRSNVL